MESTIKYIRGILRCEGITGMDSINHCIVFILCRMLDKDICDKTKINKKYAYENIMNDVMIDNEIDNQKLYNKIYVKGKDCLITEFINKLQFRNIKFKLEGVQNLTNIMVEMKKIDPNELACTYDIIGTIYEIHLKSGTSTAMRDLGQYYTHRLIINYMIKLCDPSMEKGIVEKIVDPTMGTGGFLTMAIKYLNTKYKNKINWSKNKENIIGFDIDENVRNMALLNIFLETGELMSESICKQDTLLNDLQFANGTILDKAKVILANEPMGLKNISLSTCCARVQKGLTSGSKAEPLFLRLFMEALDDDGRCAVIVPDGVLFNNAPLYNKIRKQIVENFNLKKIINLSDDFFLNTGVKTSIIFFTKDKQKTTNVEFSSVKLNNNNIVETSIIKIKYADIVKNGYSLFVNKYNVATIEKIKHIKYSKIGDVCNFKNGKTLKREKCIDGEYPVIGGGKTPSCYHNEYNCEENTILCASSGSAGYISRYPVKVWASDCFAISSKTEDLHNDYLYFYLKHIQNDIYGLQKGSAQVHVYSSDLENIEIPIPSIETQKQLIDSLALFYSNIKTSRKCISETNLMLTRYIIAQTMNITNENNINSVCDICCGKRVKKDDVAVRDDYDGNKYPCYGGGGIAFYMKEFNREGENLLISRFGLSERCVRLVIGKFWLNDSGFTLKTKSDGLLQKYLNYYVLYTKQKYIYDISAGSCQKNINMTDFGNMKIKIPVLEKQTEIIAACNEMLMSMQHLDIQIANNEKIIRSVMDEYLKNVDADDSDTESDDVNIISDSSSDEQIKPVSKKIFTTKKNVTVSNHDSDTVTNTDTDTDTDTDTNTDTDTDTDIGVKSVKKKIIRKNVSK